MHHLAGNYSAALDCMFRIKAAPGDGFASLDDAGLQSPVSRDCAFLAHCTLRLGTDRGLFCLTRPTMHCGLLAASHILQACQTMT